MASTAPAAYTSAFRHEEEDAGPGWYTVHLDTPGVDVELTATMRGAVHRYTWPAGVDAERLVVVDLAHAVPDGHVQDGGLTLGGDGRSLEGWVLNTSAFSERYGGIAVYFAPRFD